MAPASRATLTFRTNPSFSESVTGILEAYASALRERGVSAHDEEVLVEMLRATPAPYPAGAHGEAQEPLLPFLAARLADREIALLVATVAEVHAHGPRGHFADAWRVVYRAGCPLDHVWRTLWHSFKDPSADPQDDVWLPDAQAEDNVRAYVARKFPRSGAPNLFGPGLGCDKLVAGAQRSARNLRRVGAPLLLLVHVLNAARRAFTPAARALLDHGARIQSAEIAKRPKPADLERVRDRVKAGRDISDADWAAASWLLADPTEDERFVLPEDRLEHVVDNWVGAVQALVASQILTVDLAADRYRLTSEAATARSILERGEPGPRSPAAGVLATMLEAWRPTGDSYFGGIATLENLEGRDPLFWLVDVAEMSCFERMDWETGKVVVRAPTR